ncbi:GlxA family transcriptional regulator [Pararhizobium sp. BT-229]|uniref:GlxA family transcriptional regulator n=1 Tax=Pararhizobium sp. BT-229 TaxID=2986923 RepID=UPI0021F719E8|nr:GlxA family transcriptional regulator [Pararhizobium sp. BT-229]MCV9966004.1 GlxA family transcriptional regulator [Pararhizobium sp. BT-229]
MALGEPAEIGIVIYPEAQRAAIHGLTDLFHVANMMSEEQGGRTPARIRVSHWQLSADGASVEKAFDSHPDLPHRGLIALILPPSLTNLPVGKRMGAFPGWIRAQHGAGTTICSICGGAYLMAETGLLDGRVATTHWTHSEQISGRFPGIKVDVSKLIIDDGDIITAGAMMAWIDLGLKLVARFMSPSIQLATARFMLVDPSGREQTFYSTFAPKLHHGDEAVLKIQHWLQAHHTEKITLEMMAERAGLGERTFLRRFQKATGLNPTEYCQQLRIAKARELLEISSIKVEQIAWQIGYEDPGAFRKIFRKLLGLSPGEYRRRFFVGEDAGETAVA